AGQPRRPRLVGQLMVALDATGREAEAHRVYRAFHAALRDLGLDPCADLLALDRSIAVGHARPGPEASTGNLGITPSEPRGRMDTRVLHGELPPPPAPGLVLARVPPLPRSSRCRSSSRPTNVAELLAMRRVVSIRGCGP